MFIHVAAAVLPSSFLDHSILFRIEDFILRTPYGVLRISRLSRLIARHRSYRLRAVVLYTAGYYTKSFRRDTVILAEC